METLFFTIVALFFFGIAVYYIFQRGKQGSFSPKKKQKPEIISPEPQLYAGSDGAPTLEQALQGIQDEPVDKETLSHDQTTQEPLIDNQDSAGNQDEKPDMDLNEERNKDWDKEQETERKL